MATLAQTASRLRRLSLYVIVAIIVILALDIGGRFLNSPFNPFVEISSFYLAADSRLGDIPEPKVPSLTISSDSNPTFSVEGAFKAAPETVLVYSLTQPRVTFDTVDTAVRTAAALGFTDPYTEPSAQDMQWENGTKTKILKFNKLTKSWNLRTQYFFDPAALQPKQLDPETANYTNKVASLLTALGFRDQSLISGTQVALFAKLGVDGFFTKPLSSNGADYVVMDVFRKVDSALIKDTNALSEAQRQIANPPGNLSSIVYRTDPRQGSFHVVASNRLERNDQDIFGLDFTDFGYGTNYGIYQAVTPQEAWERVRTGKGSLTLLQLQADDFFAPSRTLEITKFTADANQTELAYYEPDRWEGFVFPIFIFRGRAETKDGKLANFVFYVDALRRTN